MPIIRKHRLREGKQLPKVAYLGSGDNDIQNRSSYSSPSFLSTHYDRHWKVGGGHISNEASRNTACSRNLVYNQTSKKGRSCERGLRQYFIASIEFDLDQLRRNSLR